MVVWPVDERWITAFEYSKIPNKVLREGHAITAYKF